MKQAELNIKQYCGFMPNKTLIRFLSSMPKGKALDLGAGMGRNSIFLAESGFSVEAIDKNAQELAKLQDYIDKNNIPISIKIIDIKDFSYAPNKYSLIIATSSIDFLKNSEIEVVFNKIKNSLIDKGFIYFSVFSIKDPLFNKIRSLDSNEIEENTFYLPKHNIHRHFFTKPELESLFIDFDIKYIDQKDIHDTHGKPHDHNIIEILAQKK